MTRPPHTILELLLASSLLTACSADGESPARERIELRKSGVAAAGSCGGVESCGQASPDGCWCDELCVQYGDCCGDAFEICGVDECAPKGASCPPGSTCTAIDDGFDCIAPDPCDDARVGTASYECPAGWRLAPNYAGAAFCLREQLPVTAAVSPRCDHLGDGWIGYVDAGAAACTADATTVANAPLQCRYDFTPAKRADPYCHWIDQGYFGFSWDVCPAGSHFELGPANEQRCMVRPKRLPVGATAYCDYAPDGYFGFYWNTAADPGYACPPGMRTAGNGGGQTFCLAEDAQWPAAVRPLCDLGSGFVGVEWGMQCEP